MHIYNPSPRFCLMGRGCTQAILGKHSTRKLKSVKGDSGNLLLLLSLLLLLLLLYFIYFFFGLFVCLFVLRIRKFRNTIFLFFLTCFLFHIRDGLVMTQFKTLDCLPALVTASEPREMFAIFIIYTILKCYIVLNSYSKYLCKCCFPRQLKIVIQM